jgi:3-phosphoshikimate 1-carboxyvinyltransferase
MKVKLKAHRLTGTIRPPSSKSFTQRYILLAMAREGKTKIIHVSGSEDEMVAMGIGRDSNFTVDYKDHEVLITGKFKCPEKIYVGESATSYRLSMGFISGMRCRTRYKLAESLSVRPNGPLEAALSAAGVKINRISKDEIEIDSSGIQSKDVKINGELSSQFVSSLMLLSAGGVFKGKIIIEGKKTSTGYIDITEKCLTDFGFTVKREKQIISVSGSPHKGQIEVMVEADYSSAAYFIILGLLSSKEGIRLSGLSANSLQPDSAILNILKPYVKTFYTDNAGLEIECRQSHLDSIELDADQNPDLAPIMSVIGIFSENGIIIRNIGRLSFKESDRASSIIKLAEEFGASVIKDGTTLIIKKGKEIKHPLLVDFRDHRMIMAAAVAIVISGSDTSLCNTENVNKSYADFFKDLHSLGVSIESS